MNNYIPLLLSFVCVGVHAMEHGAPVYAQIRYYKTFDDASDDKVSGRVTVAITPEETTIYDVQDALRSKLGTGHLRHGSVREPGERSNYRSAEPFDDVNTAKKNLENDYSFWAFDLPLAPYEM
jgi:hypothetical protein